MSAPAPLDEAAMQFGLLLETAQTQQRLIASSIKQLRTHTTQFDGIVREQIRSSLSVEFGALVEESARAVETLRALKQAAGLRFAAWVAATTLTLGAIMLLVAWWLLPSSSQLEALRAREIQLNSAIATLEQRGGRIDLRHCGDSERWCVRVDRKAPAYGEQADYFVVKGY